MHVVQFRNLRENLADGDDGGLSPQQRLACTERLLEEYQQRVYRYAYRLSSCAATAEDITQEVFLRAFRSLHQLRSEAAASGWLLAIARNEFLRHCRRRATSGEVIVDPQDCDTAAEQLPSPIENQEWVATALEQLPEDFRLVLLMYYFEELSYAQIAEQLKIPLGTVMSRLSRGKAHLKAALEKSNSAPNLPD